MIRRQDLKDPIHKSFCLILVPIHSFQNATIKKRAESYSPYSWEKEVQTALQVVQRRYRTPSSKIRFSFLKSDQKTIALLWSFRRETRPLKELHTPEQPEGKSACGGGGTCILAGKTSANSHNWLQTAKKQNWDTWNCTPYSSSYRPPIGFYGTLESLWATADELGHLRFCYRKAIQDRWRNWI